MLDKITYINHLGESFSTAQDGIYAMYSDLRDYLWEYESRDTTITRFFREPVKKSFPLVIIGQTDVEAQEAKQKIYEIGERDVTERAPGQLYIGDYYLRGYIIASEKSRYLENSRYMAVELTFLSVDGLWRRETPYLLQPEEIVDNRKLREPYEHGYDSVPVPISNGALFPEFPFEFHRPSRKKTIYPEYDFPHDYVRTAGNAKVNNTSFAPCEFKMIIYGFVVNPRIVIGGHVYEVMATAFEGERIEIDSRQKTIYKIGRLGEVTNLFNARGKIESCFERIPKGWNNVAWPATYRVELVMYDERSEPVWT